MNRQDADPLLRTLSPHLIASSDHPRLPRSPHHRRSAHHVISHAGGLLAWIEANLPELNEDRHHPRQALPLPGAVTAAIDIRARVVTTVTELIAAVDATTRTHP
ncbi:hypothetical protein ACQP2U_24725 [Nocardia sp. CA-084685]|uniref:hypothetical protein n=1 Tax=Nocardia sp. CA-084685 TaxID=3239970 RepID=UPI003D992B54